MFRVFPPPACTEYRLSLGGEGRVLFPSLLNGCSLPYPNGKCQANAPLIAPFSFAKRAKRWYNVWAMDTKIIVGLGNPGIQYAKTRHNAGYQALDKAAELLSVRVTKKGFSAEYGEGVHNGGRIVLVKPTTYMNLSGDAVQKVMHFYKVKPENLIVLYDDIDLPVGALRIRAGGSAGTHNGMRSVVACVNSEDFLRIRIGIGDERKGELADYVLAKPGAEQQALLSDAFAQAAEAAVLLLDGQLDKAQARFNKKHVGAAAKADAPR